VLNTDARVPNRMVKQQEEQLAKKGEEIAVLQAMLLKKVEKRLELQSESKGPHSAGGTVQILKRPIYGDLM
jgi:hypothetical protein